MSLLSVSAALSLPVAGCHQVCPYAAGPGARGDSAPPVTLLDARPDTSVDASVDAPAGGCGLAVRLDGTLDEPAWASLERHTLENVVYRERRDVFVDFRARWDTEALYLGVVVRDAVLHKDTPSVSEDDSIEVYFDIGGERNDKYDENDYQFICRWDDPVVWEIRGRSDGVGYAFAEVSGGYTAEIVFPWTRFGLTPGPGVRFNFDVGYNIDQDGGERDGQLMWSGFFYNWINTTRFGTLQIEADCSTKAERFED